MTDPVTDLGEIAVVGQRRSNRNEAFPVIGGAGETPDPPSETGETNGGGGGEGPVQPRDRCATAAGALEVNADAAAAAAAKEFASRAIAQGEDLNTREWGAYLYRNADGSVRVGPINSGPEFRFGGNGTVSLIEDVCRPTSSGQCTATIREVIGLQVEMTAHRVIFSIWMG